MNIFVSIANIAHTWFIAEILDLVCDQHHAIGLMLHRMSLMAAVLSEHGYDHYNKRSIKLARLSFTAAWQVTYRSYIDYLKFSSHINRPFELHFQGQLHMGAYLNKH